MAVNVEDFADYIGADLDEHSVALTRALSVASALTAQRLANAYKEVPEAIYDQIVLDTAYDTYKRAENTDGQYEDSNTLRAPNNPMNRSESLIRLYVMGV